MFAVPKGYRFAAINAGFRKADRDDLGLVESDRSARSAAVFTRNRFCAAPVLVARETVRRHATARAILVNSGTANACTGEEGVANCRATREMVAAAAGLQPDEVLPASTGVIGQQLDMSLWEKAVPRLVADLGRASAEDFARAIMTTDAFPKMAGDEVSIGGERVTVLGIAKGAGMICPDMATMICVALCDAEVDSQLWRSALSRAADRSFNRVTVDGDTSTNDTIFALANGASGARAGEREMPALEECLTSVLQRLAFMLVQDGEGATKVMRIRIMGALTLDDAEKAARAVGGSQLVKTAMYGRDANWGRIVAAIGRSGAAFEPSDVEVSLCGVLLFQNGQPVPGDFDARLEEPLKNQELAIDIRLGRGKCVYELLASDLTHAYIDCNAAYRS